jgi:hypothetical protein
MALTDNLQKSYLIKEISENTWGITVGDVAGPDYPTSRKSKKVGKLAKGQSPADKVEWNNKRYGTEIWALTPDEKRNIQKITTDFLNKQLR